MGWNTLNMVSSLGAVLLAAGGALLLWNIARSLRRGAVASDNPWNADTLEWATTSPPASYNFLELPVVEGRHALWERPPRRRSSRGFRRRSGSFS